MSLDVSLETDTTTFPVAADFLEEHGFGEAATYLRSRQPEICYEADITHNLNRMASEAGIYQACWRPEEIGVTKAGQLVPLLRAGLEKLRAVGGKVPGGVRG